MHQDAHEFLNYLLNVVAEILQKEQKEQKREQQEKEEKEAAAAAQNGTPTAGGENGVGGNGDTASNSSSGSDDVDDKKKKKKKGTLLSLFPFPSLSFPFFGFNTVLGSTNEVSVKSYPNTGITLKERKVKTNDDTYLFVLQYCRRRNVCA
jgi:hypothetical protein